MQKTARCKSCRVARILIRYGAKLLRAEQDWQTQEPLFIFEADAAYRCAVRELEKTMQYRFYQPDAK